MTGDVLDGSVIDRLFAVIEDRKTADPEESYTARLRAGGRAGIARKTGEEAVETIVAAMAGDAGEVARESADLLYHLLVLWSDAGVRPADVRAELARREGASGLEEKRSRSGGRDLRGSSSGGRDRMAYDDENVFAKVLRGEIPCDKVHEDDHALAFNDIDPQRPVHVLVIPKGRYVDVGDFAANASDAEIAGLFRAVGKVAEKTGVAKDGYRILSNVGAHGHQEVPHLHVHVFGGADAGPMIKRQD